MSSRSEEAKGELLRVRRELAVAEEQIEKQTRLLDHPDLGEKDREDARLIRQVLWREKEHLRSQETIFLKLIYNDPSQPAPMNFSGVPQNGNNIMPLASRQSPVKTPRNGRPKMQRRREQPIPDPSQLTSIAGLSDPSVSLMSSFEPAEYTNVNGYEVNRSSDCKVSDVWREWKEGINGCLAIEKLEEARKKDRKLIWWKHKNDYKYWSKQMRIIHAVEQKAGEFGGNLEAGIQFWEEILRVEFEGSISKLREALGGDKTSAESREAGLIGEMSAFKRQRKELLQQGLERLKQWPSETQPGLL